jgi:hypothetical protein
MKRSGRLVMEKGERRKVIGKRLKEEFSRGFITLKLRATPC